MEFHEQTNTEYALLDFSFLDSCQEHLASLSYTLIDVMWACIWATIHAALCHSLYLIYNHAIDVFVGSLVQLLPVYSL